jgi:serine/threonine protein kinase
MLSAEEFCNGAADLYMEAKYLTALAAHPHPALVQLHGVCRDGPKGFATTHDRAGFFLIMDRLYDTLDRRIQVWEELAQRKLASSNSDLYLRALFLQRLLVTQDIASAVRHLHKLNVVYRDLKPDNVGFDFDGQVKVFDFGLAKELDAKVS